jgi:hypothetical protein
MMNLATATARSASTSIAATTTASSQLGLLLVAETMAAG